MAKKKVEKTMSDALFRAIIGNGTDIVTKEEVEEFRSANSSYCPNPRKVQTKAAPKTAKAAS